MLAFIATYLIAALILEVMRRRVKKPLLIRSGRKHLPWKLNYSFGWWGIEEYLAAATVGSFVLLVIFTFWIYAGVPISRKLGWVFWILLCLSSSALSIRHFKLVKMFKAHAWWLTLFGALITIGFGLVASAYADFFILTYTRTDAAQFPVAQKTLGMLLLMFFWVYSVTLLIAGAVSIGYPLMHETLSPTASIKNYCLPAQFGKKYKSGRNELRHATLRVIAVSGLLITFISISGVWALIFAHAEEAVQETLVFASFHLHPRDCGIPGMPQGAKAALISEKHAVVAIPEAKGYAFETMPCEVLSARALRDEAAKRLKQDDYL